MELEVLGADGEARPPRPLRLSLLELLGKLVRRDQPNPPQPHPPQRKPKHNHRFRTFVSCGTYRLFTFVISNSITILLVDMKLRLDKHYAPAKATKTL